MKLTPGFGVVDLYSKSTYIQENTVVFHWYTVHKGRFTIPLFATRHAICDSCDKKMPVASCPVQSQGTRRRS